MSTHALSECSKGVFVALTITANEYRSIREVRRKRRLRQEHRAAIGVLEYAYVRVHNISVLPLAKANHYGSQLVRLLYNRFSDLPTRMVAFESYVHLAID